MLVLKYLMFTPFFYLFFECFVNKFLYFWVYLTQGYTNYWFGFWVRGEKKILKFTFPVTVVTLFRCLTGYYTMI